VNTNGRGCVQAGFAPLLNRNIKVGNRKWEVIGAATKSSSPESRRTTAGRNLPPGVCGIQSESGRLHRLEGSWIAVRTPSHRQRMPPRIAAGQPRARRRLPRRYPIGVHLNLFPRRDPRSDLRRNADLTVGREFASEVGGLHLCSSLFISSHVSGAMGVRRSSLSPGASFRVARDPPGDKRHFRVRESSLHPSGFQSASRRVGSNPCQTPGLEPKPRRGATTRMPAAAPAHGLCGDVWPRSITALNWAKVASP